MRLLLLAGLVLAPTTALAQGVCPGREDALAALEEAVVTFDLDSVQGRIDEVVAAFDCGRAAQPEQMARLWNAEGSYLLLEGDPAAAEESFQAAKRVAPDLWTEAFGPKMRAAWDDTPDAVERGTIQVDPRLTWWVVLIDGEPTKIPAQVPTGLHIVQGGPSPDDVRFGKLVYVRPGGIAVAVHDEQEGIAPTVAADIEDAVDPTRVFPRFTAQTAAGAGFSFGRADRNEPAAKLPMTLEVSGIVRMPLQAGGERNVWIRPGVSALPLLGGKWAFEGVEGESEVPNGLGIQLAAGARNVQGDVGGLVAWQWPGRVQMRIIAALELPAIPVAVEPRVGLNVGRGAEPAVEVLVAYRPPVIW